MFASCLPSILALITLAVAASSRRTHHVLHEKRAAEPVDWVNVGRLQPGHVLPMRFGLSQQNLHMVEEMLTAISHPDSPNFGSHMSAAEVNDAFAPSTATLHSVVDWLGSAGIAKERLRLTHNSAWVELNATTAEMENLLDTEYHLYVHEETGAEQIGCHSYSVPAHISEHIDLIRPTVHFKHKPPASASKNDLRKRMSMHLGNQHSSPQSSNLASASNANGSDLSNCNQLITLDCLRALYKINYTPTQSSINSFGIVEFSDNSYEPTDLDIFYKKYAPSLVGSRPKSVFIDGGKLIAEPSSNNNLESDLDIQYASGLVAPLTLTLLEVGNGAGAYDDWLDAVDGSFCTADGDDPIDPTPINQLNCGVVSPPYVVSVSYGGSERAFPLKYLARQCTEYAKLGLMGTSILYASQDEGVAQGGAHGEVCLTPDGQQSINGTRFNPTFPATCPYVTAVGATQMVNGSSINDPEVACETVIRSGGGFSDIFEMPDYQASAVTNYLTSTPPPYPASVFNNSGAARAFPDLSANGAFYDTALDGILQPLFGTSAATPVVASMIVLVNDARLAAGKKPIGFLNPIIYSESFQAGFNDIVKGNNHGCGTLGFSAVEGWDPVTGLGTPNMEVLMPLFLALP
ncbi:subtilisin-like protein [Athelia psychrophila]|uniref:tripeptidyl-peptidase II n=1 Tax=Athelia psychrophila TaxID=1759441 RepID=A0A166HUL9_9AGAM|nr:subtilisin-like protein [Fibularhizoctonia sp. CBS 109695]